MLVLVVPTVSFVLFVAHGTDTRMHQSQTTCLTQFLMAQLHIYIADSDVNRWPFNAIKLCLFTGGTNPYTRITRNSENKTIEAKIMYFSLRSRSNFYMAAWYCCGCIFHTIPSPAFSDSELFLSSFSWLVSECRETEEVEEVGDPFPSDSWGCQLIRNTLSPKDASCGSVIGLSQAISSRFAKRVEAGLDHHLVYENLKLFTICWYFIITKTLT